jgi:hypothetical protein
MSTHDVSTSVTILTAFSLFTPTDSRSHARPRLGRYCLHRLGPRKRSPDRWGRGRRLRTLPAGSKNNRERLYLALRGARLG